MLATVKGVGHKYSRDDMVAAIANVTLRDGVAKLTFRNVAEELGTSDRMVVYYFPAKEDLVLAAVAALSSRMQSDRKSTRLNSSHSSVSRMPSSA